MTNMSTVEALKLAKKWFDDGLPNRDMPTVITAIKSALSEIENSEPVAEAIRERNRLGFSVVNVIGKLDEIIENNQEVEIDDFLHIAVPIDMWNELIESLEQMPSRADLFTFPPKREWKGLSRDEKTRLSLKYSGHLFYELCNAIEAKLKELNHDLDKMREGV